MKIEITCITPVLQAFLDFFSPNIICVGRSQIEWKLKVKTDICRKECYRELKCLVNLIRRTIISNSGDT